MCLCSSIYARCGWARRYVVRRSWESSSGDAVGRALDVMYRTEVSAEAVGAADATLVQGRRRSGMDAWNAVISMSKPSAL